MGQVKMVLRVDARPGCEEALAVGLDAALARLRKHTLAGGWTRVRLGPNAFGIFETRGPLKPLRGSGTFVPPEALLADLQHLVAGAPHIAPGSQATRVAAVPKALADVAMIAIPKTAPRSTRPLSPDALRPLPAALRLF